MLDQFSILRYKCIPYKRTLSAPSRPAITVVGYETDTKEERGGHRLTYRAWRPGSGSYPVPASLIHLHHLCERSCPVWVSRPEPFQPLNERTNNRRNRPNPMLTLSQIPGDRTVACVPASYLRTLTKTMVPTRLAFHRYALRVVHCFAHTHVRVYM